MAELTVEQQQQTKKRPARAVRVKKPKHPATREELLERIAAHRKLFEDSSPREVLLMDALDFMVRRI